jgi:hypothetical protein
MRKITRLAVDAFMAGRPFHQGNTSVEMSECGHAVMKLHGNRIAIKDNNGSIRVSDAGWPTATTKERLNGIPGVSIHQKNYQWYLNDKHWDGFWVNPETFHA